ncbi:MAG: hypothetical protein AB7Q29_10010 [Vicinamibacterales bacterium]
MGVRTTVALLTLVALLVAAPSQAQRPPAPQSAQWHPSIGLPLPSIGLALPSIGLPHPPTGLPPLDTRPLLPVGSRPADSSRAARGNRGGGRRVGAGVVLVPLVVPFVVAPMAVAAPAGGPPRRTLEPASPPAPRQQAFGTVWLEIEPAATVQVYVDEFYVGETEGLGGRLDLEVGSHVLELRTPGNEPLRFKVQIDSGRPLTYRDTFRPLGNGSPQEAHAAGDSAPALDSSAASGTGTPPTAAPPMTLYLIPGCYAGNVPPDEIVLPDRCDKVRTMRLER